MAAIASVAKFFLPGRSVGDWLGQPVQDAVLAVQHGRLMKVLCELSDEQLKAIGITRQEIPAYAHKLVYDEK